MAPPVSEVLPDLRQVHEMLLTFMGIKGTHYEIIEPVNNIVRQGAIAFSWVSDQDTFIDP